LKPGKICDKIRHGKHHGRVASSQAYGINKIIQGKKRKK